MIIHRGLERLDRLSPSELERKEGGIHMDRQKSEERIRSTDYRTSQTSQVKKQFLWDVLAENNRSLGT